MTTKQTKLQNARCGKEAMEVLAFCEGRYPAIDGAKALLLASVSLANACGISRKLYLATARAAFDALKED